MSTTKSERRRQPSLFGPIILISLGLFLLLSELNPVTDLHWGDLLRLWPLLLIFLGLNLLVLQAPRPLGSLLSGAVALTAVAVTGYILLVGLPGSSPGWLNLEDWQTREISFAGDGVTSAVMDLEIGPPGANVYALEDSNDLIAGTVLYRDELRFDQSSEDGRATVTLATDDGGSVLWLPEWLGENADDEERWQVGLSPDVPLSLSLAAAAGSSELDLRGLALEELSVNVAAGEATLFLPDGDYDVEMDTAAGSTTVSLPRSGEQTVEVNVSAGSVVLELPPGREARVEVDQALGGFDNDHGDLQRIGEDNVWQSAGYEDSDEPITIILHIAVGSATLR